MQRENVEGLVQIASPLTYSLGCYSRILSSGKPQFMSNYFSSLSLLFAPRSRLHSDFD